MTLRHFIDEPYHATLAGYQPCFLDCISSAACLVTWRNTRRTFAEFNGLLDLSVKDAPFALLKALLVTMFYLSLPFGMFFLFGALAWFLQYRPSKLTPLVEKRKAHFKRAFNEL